MAPWKYARTGRWSNAGDSSSPRERTTWLYGAMTSFLRLATSGEYLPKSDSTNMAALSFFLASIMLLGW